MLQNIYFCQTYLKFWKRDDSGTNITLIDCFVLSHRVTFLRSTLGVHHEKEITKETEEILCVSNTGLIDVYTRDVKRKLVSLYHNNNILFD